MAQRHGKEILVIWVVNKCQYIMELIRDGKFWELIFHRSSFIYRKYQFLRLADFIDKVKTEKFRFIASSRSCKDIGIDLEYVDEGHQIERGKRRILHYNTNEQANDIKSRWEQNRMQHLPAYALGRGNNKEIPTYICNQIKNIADSAFTDTNAMEVAISAINVIEAVKCCEVVEEKEERYIADYLKKCLYYILSNTESGGRFSANHYFFDLIGALWIVNHFEFSNKKKKFIQFLTYELEKLLDQIVEGDGSLYEDSTYYHRYVSEALAEFIFFNENIVTEAEKKTAIRMVEFSETISDKNRIFGFGDNDSGRVLPFPSYLNYSSRDISTALSICRRFYDKEEQSVQPVVYKDDFGIAVRKTNHYALAFRCDAGKNKLKNKFIGVHAQNDLLSVEINFYHSPVIVNRGTFLYIPDNEYRYRNLSTKYHSTVSIDGMEQNVISNNWTYRERIHLCKNVSINADIFRASFDYGNGVRQFRKIKFGERQIVLFDGIIGLPDCQEAYAIYYIDSNVGIQRCKQGARLLFEGHEVLFLSMGSKICVCDIFPEYGQRVQSHAIIIPIMQGKVQACLKIIK